MSPEGTRGPKEVLESISTDLNLNGKGPVKIDPDQIWKRAVESKVQKLSIVRTVCDDIREGCDLKVNSHTYRANKSTNAPTAKLEGVRVTDALAHWIKKGIVVGPFDVPQRMPLSMDL